MIYTSPYELVRGREMGGEMTEALEPLLVRHQQAQDMLGLGATKYWQLVRSGQIEVVGAGAMSRAVYTSLKKYVAKLLAEAAAEKAA
jgi:hypothetical protein